MPTWFILPALILFAAVVVLPSVIGAGYSFTNSTNGVGGTFIGLENFVRVFSDPRTTGPLAQTIIMAGAIMILQNIVGLLLAVALNTQIKSRNFLRVLFFAPFVISPLVSGFLWKYILAPEGALNQVLRGIGLGDFAAPWLGHPQLALGSLVVAVVWQFTGSSMVIYLAGLQSVPEDVLEAASLDGATGFGRFWNIVRPFLAPALTVNLTLSLIAGLRIYDQILAMTSGGPGGSTDSISTVIYRVAFQFGDFGYGSALAVLLTVLVIVFTSIQFVGLRKQASA